MAGSNWTQEDVDAYNLRRKIMGKVAEAVPETHAAPVAKPRKYRNEPIIVDGIRWDSKKELARWVELRLLENFGTIRDLRRQVVFILAPSVKLYGRKRPQLKYTADFTYFEPDQSGEWLFITEDVKGQTRRQEAYKIRRHLMMSVHSIEIRET